MLMGTLHVMHWYDLLFLRIVDGVSLLFIIISFAACGFWLHHCWERSCAADAVPPVATKLVLVLLTSEG